MAVEWTITIEEKNELGDVCRREMRITKSWESLFDGDIERSISDCKSIIATLQSAVVANEAETYGRRLPMVGSSKPSLPLRLDLQLFPAPLDVVIEELATQPAGVARRPIGAKVTTVTAFCGLGPHLSSGFGLRNEWR